MNITLLTDYKVLFSVFVAIALTNAVDLLFTSNGQETLANSLLLFFVFLAIVQSFYKLVLIHMHTFYDKFITEQNTTHDLRIVTLRNGLILFDFACVVIASLLLNWLSLSIDSPAKFLSLIFTFIAVIAVWQIIQSILNEGKSKFREFFAHILVAFYQIIIMSVIFTGAFKGELSLEVWKFLATTQNIPIYSHFLELILVIGNDMGELLSSEPILISKDNIHVYLFVFYFSSVLVKLILRKMFNITNNTRIDKPTAPL